MTSEELLKKSLVELRELAKDKGIKSIPKYRKAELVEMLKDKEQAPKAAEPPAPKPEIKHRGAPKKAAKEKTEPGRTKTPNEVNETAAKKPTRDKTQQRQHKSQKENTESATIATPPPPQKAPVQDTVRTQHKKEYVPRKIPQYANDRYGYQKRYQVPNPAYHNNNTNSNNYNNSNNVNQPKEQRDNRVPDPDVLANCREVAGTLELMADGYGFLRVDNYYSGPNDIYIAPAQIRRFGLRTGDIVSGRARKQRDGDRYEALMSVDAVNGEAPIDGASRARFEDLTPIFPDQRYTLEVSGKHNNLSVRLIDLIAPIGKGQRAMIVSQPKAGKTTLLKQIANGISDNYPDAHLIVLLIDERPEEVTDMKRSIRGEVVYSTFDELPEHHTRIAEMVQERAMRLVETGKDVVILLDSLTRLTRAYNLVIPPTGRTLSGGMDPGALHKPKRFFGAARNIENGGSLTVIATALVETGSRMDDIVFEEFKGTGNMEIHLDRKLSEKRIFPAIDIYKSGTRREDLLLSKKELEGVYMIRKVLAGGAAGEVTEQFISMLQKTNTNEDFLMRLKEWVNIYEKSGYTAGSGTQNRYGQ
ncbi:MAG: transcription termination factor Rho [Eubacteriales bacterium]|nr:transcription termination factor Rho [Eubacteriales bacterium]